MQGQAAARAHAGVRAPAHRVDQAGVGVPLPVALERERGHPGHVCLSCSPPLPHPPGLVLWPWPHRWKEYVSEARY